MKIPLFALALQAAMLPVFGSDAIKLVLWNQYNGDNHDRGTKLVSVEALSNGEAAWKDDRVRMHWFPGRDTKVNVTIPATTKDVDTIRVRVLEWEGSGGGLSEVEVFRDDKDITKLCTVTTSAMLDDRFNAAKLVDGVKTSEKNYSGYWLLPDNTEGYATIELPKK